MRTIQIKNIQLINFKGIKNLSIDFEHNTDIFGRNEAGKTTIFDALIWGLFGKDSQDRKDFEIQPLDENNKVIEKIDSEVIITLVVDGETIVLRKVLLQKWQKKKGSTIPEFTGNTTEHYWNGVPMGTVREYQDKVNQICDENIFKLITNPASFMSLKWTDRREVLLKIADTQPDESLAVGNLDFENLLGKLSNNKTLEEYNKEIQASIKKAKEDLKAIPTRIDEVVRNKPQGYDFEQLQNLLDLKNAELVKINEAIQDKAGMFDKELVKINEEKTKVNSIRSWLTAEETILKNSAKNQVEAQSKNLDDLKTKISENQTTIQTYENGIVTLESKLKLLENEALENTKQVDAKREDWKKRNAETLEFEEGCWDCPTCKRLLETVDIEALKTKMQSDFIAKKQADLLVISTNAKQMQAVIESQKNEIADTKQRIENGKAFIKGLRENNSELENQLNKETENLKDQPTAEELYEVLLKDCQLYHAKKAELKEIESQIKEVPKIDYSELTSKKEILLSDISELTKKIQTKEQIETANKRIKQLQEEEETLSQQILNVERIQFIIDNFNRVKIEALENSINSKLKFVKFKMFDQQINGGEVPCCEALLNGVPYSNVNTAGRLNIGLDIINMLCEYYQVSAPIIIDNRESVTEIIECESQIINLVVSPEDETLRIKKSA